MTNDEIDTYENYVFQNATNITDLIPIILLDSQNSTRITTFSNYTKCYEKLVYVNYFN